MDAKKNLLAQIDGHQDFIHITIDPAIFRGIVREEITEAMTKGAPVPPEEKYHTRLEVCNRLRISLPTFHEYQKAGLIRSQRFGRRVLVSESDLQSALKEIPTRKRHYK